MLSIRLAVLFFLSIAILCQGKSILRDEAETNLNNRDDFIIEGDILVTSEEYKDILRRAKEGKAARHKRQLIKGGLWENNTLTFSFVSYLDKANRVMCSKAMKEISARTCIKFVDDVGAEDRVMFVQRGGCFSGLGRKGGLQALSISGCYRVGNIIHELLHALGVIHTASRYDRDQYLKMNTSFITPADGVNFEFYTPENSYNVVPFEYGSVMTYYARAAAWPLDESFTSSMGVRVTSFYDFKMIHEKYQCSCPKSIECFHGGYMNTQTCDKCVCPSGYGGKQCETAPEEFSKKLTASLDWQNYTLRFGFAEFAEIEFKRATMFIQAPADKRIQVEVTEMSGFSCLGYCYYNGFEVKHMGDPRAINQIRCCPAASGSNYNYTSKLNPTPVILYSLQNRVTLGIRYRYIDESISALPTTNNTYDDFRYPA